MNRLALLVAFAGLLAAQKPENVLVVVNESSALSRTIGDYYALKRRVPLANICKINIAPTEEIARAEYDRLIAEPISQYLRTQHLQESILYIVTTSGVPLKVTGSNGRAAVDSELTLLYGLKRSVHGQVANPFFGNRTTRFTHKEFPIYLVTRLTGYDFADVKAMVDRALVARNQGKFVIDLKSASDEQGNDWLRTAALLLPKERVVLDESETVLLNQTNVIGYAAWGSNDPHRKQRHLGFRWLPGAIVTEFVSTNGRTFTRPPDRWNLGNWSDPATWFAGAPQTLTADYIHDGATGASGHVDEPYLTFTPRPDYLLPAYFAGRNLAESYYLSIPALSWTNIVVGDPLCALK